jgi:hypothetical protein
MVSPRLRHAVPLPTPVNYTTIRRVLAVKIVATLAVWALPALFLPPAWFPVFGIPEPPLAQLVFVRLLGAAYVALVAGYSLAWRTPARHPAMVAVGVVSNALAAFVIVSVGADGAFATWSALGLVYIWSSAVLAAGLAVALVVTGQPLLRRIGDRPRPGSIKIV